MKHIFLTLLLAWTGTGAGYDGMDSAVVGGPQFMWDDIASTGFEPQLYQPGPSILYDNACTVNIEIPFPFFYGGVERLSVNANTNGCLLFGGMSMEAINAPIPSAAEWPNDYVAVFFDDLHLGTDATPGRIITEVLGAEPERRLVVTWESVTTPAGPHELTFQVALFEKSNAIRLQYLTLRDNGGGAFALGQGATVGIENAAGDAGIQYLYNGSAALSEGLAIGFVPTGFSPPWPVVPPPIVPPTNLIQSDDPGGASMPPGFVDQDPSVSLRANIVAGGALQVEVKPSGMVFDEAKILTGTSEVIVTGLDPLSYHWRARTAVGPELSPWVEFHPSQVHFTIAEPAPPEVPSIHDPPKAGCSAGATSSWFALLVICACGFASRAR